VRGDGCLRVYEGMAMACAYGVVMVGPLGVVFLRVFDRYFFLFIKRFQYILFDSSIYNLKEDLV
jgi:hypothetical protein